MGLCIKCDNGLCKHTGVQNTVSRCYRYHRNPTGKSVAADDYEGRHGTVAYDFEELEES